MVDVVPVVGISECAFCAHQTEGVPQPVVEPIEGVLRGLGRDRYRPGEPRPFVNVDEEVRRRESVELSVRIQRFHGYRFAGSDCDRWFRSRSRGPARYLDRVQVDPLEGTLGPGRLYVW